MVSQAFPWRRSVRRLLLMALLAGSLVLIGVFSLRAIRDYRRLQYELTTGTTDVERIRGWMTVPYIARAYDVPPQVVFAALAIPETGNERLNIPQLATKYRRDAVEVRTTIQRAILVYQGSRTAPPEGSP
jgi:hypothetical protein